MSKMDLYWILKLDSLGSFLFTMLVLSVVILAVVIIVMVDENDGGEVNRKKMAKYLTIEVIAVFCLSILITLVPTTKQYLIMSGGEFLTNNEKVIMTADKAYEMLDNYMDKVLTKGTEKVSE